MNNPLNATDPSGFIFKKFARAFKGLWNEARPFVGAIVAAVMTFYCGTACGIGIWKAVVIGAVSGAAGAAANGGNIFKGALIGGLSGAAFHGIGDSFGIKTGDFFGTKLSIGDFISKTALHGLVGGVMSVLQGGKFGHGFASAGVTQAFSGQIDRLDINTAQSKTIGHALKK